MFWLLFLVILFLAKAALPSCSGYMHAFGLVLFLGRLWCFVGRWWIFNWLLVPLVLLPVNVILLPMENEFLVVFISLMRYCGPTKIFCFCILKTLVLPFYNMLSKEYTYLKWNFTKSSSRNIFHLQNLKGFYQKRHCRSIYIWIYPKTLCINLETKHTLNCI